MALDVVNFYFGGVGGHENGAFNFEEAAAVGNSLGMVAGTCGDDSSLFLLLGQFAEGGGGSSHFKTSDWLEILSFEVDIGFVLFREEGGFLKFGFSDDRFIFAVGLVDLVGWDQC